MSDNILDLRIEDHATAAAEAATAAVDGFGEAAEQTEVKLSRLSRTSAQLVNRYDEVTRAENRLAREQAKAAELQAAWANDVAVGTITAEQAARANEGLAASVAKYARELEQARAKSAGGAADGIAAQAHDLTELERATQLYGGSATRAAAAAQAMADASDPLGAIYRQEATELERLDALEKAKLITGAVRVDQERRIAEATRERISEMFNSSDAARKSAAAEAEAARERARVEAEAARVAAAAEAELNRQARDFIATHDPAAASAARFTEQIATANKLYAAGRINHEQYEAGLRNIRNETNQAATATAGASGMLRNLGVQSIDVFQQLASGAPVMQTLVQQGGQIAQVAATSGGGLKAWGELGTAAFRAVVSPAGLAVTAIGATAAAVAYLAVTTESADRRLRGLTETLRATRTDAATVAPMALAAARGATLTGTGIGLDDARGAAAAFAAQPNFTGSEAQLQDLIVTANNLAVRLGTTLPEAAALLAKGLRDPVAMATELKDKLVGFDSELIRTVGLQQRAGDTATAWSTGMRVVKTETAGAAEAIQTKLTKSWDEFKKELTSATDGGSTLGGALIGAMTWYVGYLTELVRLTRRAADAITAAAPASANPAASLGSGAGAYAGTTGAVTTSDAGALGMFQVMPATAAQYGIKNPSDPQQNILAGITYLRDLQARNNGDVAATLRTYGGFKTKDPSEYIAKVANADTSVLDRINVTGAGGQVMTAAQAIEYVAQTAFGASRADTDFYKRVAVVESGGRHYAPGTTLAPLAVTVPPTPKVDLALPAGNTDGASTKADTQVKDAVTRALDMGSGGANKQALADIANFNTALQTLAAQGETSGERVAALREGLTLASKAAADAIPAAARLTRDLTDQTKAETDLTEAYGAGYDAVRTATAGIKAEEAARGVAARGTVEYIAVVAALTQKYLELADAQARREIAAQGRANRDQLEMIQAETAALGMSDAARATYLASLRAEQELKRRGIDTASEFGRAYVQSAADVALATTELERQKGALAEVSSFAEQFGSNMANAISQAFLTGQGQAVNWANVTKAAIAQVANEALKLSFVNPVLNATVGGQHRTTLGDVIGVIGAGAPVLAQTGPAAEYSATNVALSGMGSLYGPATLAAVTEAQGMAPRGGSGILNTASNLFQIGSVGDKLGLTNVSGQVSRFTDSIGLTGGDGLTSTVSNWLATPLPFTDVAGATNAALASLPNGMAGPATASQFTAAGGATIGQFIGGVGAGYGLGSLAGGFVQNSLGKVGPAPQIGAGGGAIAGAAIGSFVPVIGTMLGAIVGGLLGGAGGGLIGPKAASPFTSTELAVDSAGMLSVGQTVSQIADPTQEVAALRSDVANLNTLLANSGAKVATTGAITQIGQNSPNGAPDPSKAANLAATLPDLRFTSDDPLKAAALADKSFASVDELSKALVDVTTAAAATTELLDKTVPALVAASKTNSTFADQIKAVTGTYTAAIDQAKSLAEKAGQPAETVDKLNTAQTDLAAARDTAAIRVIDSALESLIPAQDGSLPAQVAAITKQYGDAIESVKQALAANDNSAVVTDRLTKAETDLAAARERATTVANEAAAEATRTTERALLLRTLAADAAVNGNQARAQSVREMALGEQQRLESLNFGQQLVATFGEAFRETEDFAQRTAALDQAHYAERLLFQKQFNDQSAANDRARTAQIYSLWSRQATAEAAVSGDPARVQAAALQAFDERARIEKESTAAQEVATYGEAFRQTQAFADMATQVDRTLYAERLALQKQFADQATAQDKAAAEKAAGLISNLAAFAVQLQTGPQSALSAQDQYAVARANFESTRDKARTGDADALAGVQGAVTTLLTASRALNGSGAAYAADFGEALSTVTDFGQVAPETLTAGVFTAETRSAAERVVDALAELRAAPVAATATPIATPGLTGTTLPVALTDSLFATETRAASAAIVGAVNGNAQTVVNALAGLTNVVPFPTRTADTLAPPSVAPAALRAPDPITIRMDTGDLLSRADFAAVIRESTIAIVAAVRRVEDAVTRGSQDQRTRTLIPQRMTG